MTPERTLKVRTLAREKYLGIHRKMTLKNASGGYEVLCSAMEEALLAGCKDGLNSEAKAWQRVNELEDLIISMLRYTSDSDIAKCHAIERETFDADAPSAFAKAVAVAMGSTA